MSKPVMQIYEIIYSVHIGAAITVEANSEDEAVDIFNNTELEVLFEKGDMLQGLVIDEITQIDLSDEALSEVSDWVEKPSSAE
jgi:hypothetical protein